MLNRVTQTTAPDNTSVTYSYDNLGNRLSLTDNVGSTTSFTYNNGELLTEITDALDKHTSFVYDNLAQLTSVTDRNNHTINYEYTDVGNLSKVLYPDTTEVNFDYDLAGNLKTITEDLGTTSFTYDNLHRLTDLVDAQGYNIKYEYDSLGNVTKLIYPGVGKEVVYTYDELSRLKTVTAWTGDVATYNYDDAGRLVSVVNFNGTTSSFAFDKASRVNNIQNKKTTNEIISSYKFTLDGNGNRIKSLQNEPQQLSLPSSDTAFTYNTNRNRLLQAGDTQFTYDDEGQLFSKDTATFTFDYEHRLKSISDSGLDYQYTYDAKGTRLSAYRDGVVTKYIYDAAGNLLAEADEQGIITRYYVYGAGLLAAITPTDQVYTYHFNGNGNTIAITDSNQNIVNSYSYTPFGSIASEQENIENRFKFVGQFGIMHEVGDIYYVRARYLDANVGRFISEDPSGFTDGPNLFAYVLNNPINSVDTTGLLTLQIGLQRIAGLLQWGYAENRGIVIGLSKENGLQIGTYKTLKVAGGTLLATIAGGADFAISNNDNINKLAGDSITSGGSLSIIADIGLDADQNQFKSNYHLNLGLGVGALGGETHFYKTNTIINTKFEFFKPKKCSEYQ